MSGPKRRRRNRTGLESLIVNVSVLALVLAAGQRAEAQPGPGDDLHRAAESWTRRGGPERRVIDQVCLVPDVATFFEAIATWDERHFYPILIDDIEYAFKFLRAFRPARVVRYPRKGEPIGQGQEWAQASAAVGRAWTGETAGAVGTPSGDAVPARLGPTPPGVVLSAPDSPMLAGAVALAAGRFQPLVRWDVSKRYADVLSADEADALAAGLEIRVTAAVPSHDRLGDDCDFLTLAGDWPYRYNAAPTARSSPDIRSFGTRNAGPYAFDDLIGRQAGGAARWAFSGRLLGDARASVYRAMCSLFLQPRSALLVNTYSEHGPGWSDYAMPSASRRLERILPTEHRSGPRAGLAGWHQAFDPFNRRGLVLINSHGGPTQFHVTDGSAVPGDIPVTEPAVVLMTHSFSAADPADPKTIAGRWLANGAFVYFGSMFEPALQSFPTPDTVAARLAEQLPLSASMRQSPPEPFGWPWRLVYLGDPLYRIKVGSEPPRVAPADWPVSAGWPRYEVSAPPPAGASDSDRLRWAVRTTVARLQRDASRSSPPPKGGDALLAIRRPRLEPALRPYFDALLADTLIQDRRPGTLQIQLKHIPPDERSPMVRRLLETCEVQLLERYVVGREFVHAEKVWSELIRSDASRDLLEQVTARVGRLADASAHRADWSALLAAAGRLLKHTQAADVIAAEQKRINP
jgi:hypothetical protein